MSPILLHFPGHAKRQPRAQITLANLAKQESAKRRRYSLGEEMTFEHPLGILFSKSWDRNRMGKVLT